MSSETTVTTVSEQEQPVEYRSVPDFPNYRVGNDGSVWSRLTRFGRRRLIPSNPWRALKPRWNKRKLSMSVTLCPPGRTFYVHHLVLNAFVGPRPHGMECCHNDGNAKNNHVDNLRWDTRSANMLDKIRHGTHNKGSRHPMAKLTEDDASRIRAEYATGTMTQQALAWKYGVSRKNVSKVITRKSWKHVEAVMPAGREP